MSDARPQSQPQGASGFSYVSQFRAHLAEVRAHLVGAVGDHPPPSFIPPTGYWTPSEKNAFFHSLSVYSRLRPDLVAASIGSKSIVDVCAYIDVLDEAIARHGHMLPPRSDLPSAMEVSNVWISREENMAEDIIPLETSWERDKLLLQREEEISIKKGSQVDAPPIEEGLVAETLETWERVRRRCWGQEDTLSKLECHHLKVMERILNEAESGDTNVEEPRPEDQETEPADETPPSPSDRDSQSFVTSDGMLGSASQRYLETPHVETSHDMLLALSFASSPQASSSDSLVVQPLGYSRLPSPDGDRETGIDHSTLSPVSRRRIQKRFYMRRKRAAQRGEDADVVTRKLQPGRKTKASRSRVKQFIELDVDGRDEDDLMEVDQGDRGAIMSNVNVVTRRLQPGRKAKASRSRGNQPIKLNVDGRDEDALMEVDQGDGEAVMSTRLSPGKDGLQKAGIDDNNEEDHSEKLQGHRRNKGGITKPYKTKKDLETKGIDCNTLIDGNLGFFHLSILSKLMTFYKSGYDVEQSDAASSISADTIRLFSAILVEFVTEVVHRSITLRERENSMKADIKVYRRTSDDITVENVMHVLEMMGMMGLSKEQYFAQLLEDDTPASSETEQADDEVEADGSEYDGEDEEDEDANDPSSLKESTVFPLLLPLQREIYPPLVTLPKSLIPRSQARPKSVAPADDYLMPAETDEEELSDELRDEMSIEDADQVLAQNYETDLWKLLSGR